MSSDRSLHTALFNISGAPSTWQVAAEIDSQNYPPYSTGNFPALDNWKASLRFRPEENLIEGVGESDANLGAALLDFICNDEIKNILNFILGQGSHTIVLEIKTTDTFLANLPWEACTHFNWRKLDMDQPQARIIVVRTPVRYRNYDLEPQEPIRLLVASSSPKDNIAQHVLYEREQLEYGLLKGFRKNNQRTSNHRYLIKEEAGVTLSNFGAAIRENQPHLVHFISHGGAGFLEMQNAGSDAIPIYGREVAEALRNGSGSLFLFVTTSCLSMSDDVELGRPSLGKYVIEQIPYAIGMQMKISEAGAIDFTREFYHALAEPRSILGAYIYSRDSLINSRSGHPDWIAPVFFQGGQEQRKLFFDLSALPGFLRSAQEELSDLSMGLGENYKNKSGWGNLLSLINQVLQTIVTPYRQKFFAASTMQAGYLDDIETATRKIRSQTNSILDLLEEGQLTDRMTFGFSDLCENTLILAGKLILLLDNLRITFDS